MRQSKGPLLVSSNDPLEINLMLERIRVELDELAGLSGQVIVNDTLKAERPESLDDVVNVRELTKVETGSLGEGVDYTPDLTNGPIHRISVGGTGAHVVNAPLDPNNRREIVLVISNDSGGAIAVTFDSLYLQGGWVDPGDGKSRTGRFFYDTSSQKWTQVGQWSNELS